MTPLLALTLVGGFGGGYIIALQINPSCPQAQDTCTRFINFWKAWNLVSAHYVDPQAINPEKMIDGAISGMIDSLGDHGHTRYLSAETASRERESISGRFEGIGAYIAVRDDQPLITQPIEGSPAERAGVRPGDLILKIDGTDMHGATVDQVRAMVIGPKGTTVTLTLQHPGEQTPVDIAIMRAEIDVPSLSWRKLANNTALIRLSQFTERSGQEMKQALTDAKAQGVTSIILDLRNNNGGLVSTLIDIASEFLPPDTTVLLEQDRSGKRTPYKTSDDGIAKDIPLVVLVNNNTASAAEILAGAFQDAGRARVIGIPTFGTATVLRTFDLNDGAQLRIGTTQWLTPKGHVVRDKGITPDELVPLPPEIAPLSPIEAAQLNAQDLLKSNDVQLKRGIQILGEHAPPIPKEQGQ